MLSRVSVVVYSKMNKKDNLRKAQKAAEKTGLVIILLVLAKGLIGFITGSVVLLSDAFHSASDLISIIASWFGLKISQKKPNEKFPFGFYKAENLAALTVSFLIAFIAVEFFREGIARLKIPTQLNFPILAVAVAVVAVTVDWFLSRYLQKVSQQTNSSSLKVAAKDKKADVFVSSTVFASLLFTSFNIPWAEGLVTIMISALLLKVAFESGKESLFVLIDVGPGREFTQRLAREVEKVVGVEECLEIKLRQSGPFLFGEAIVGVRRQINISRAHRISDMVEQALSKKYPQIDNLSIHVEPFKSNFSHLVIPVEEKGNLQVPVAEKFGRAPYLLFVNLSGKNIKGFFFIKNSYQNRKVKAGLATAKLVSKQKSEVLITKEIGEISFHYLRDSLVDVYRFRGKTAKDAIGDFLKGSLKILNEPKQQG